MTHFIVLILVIALAGLLAYAIAEKRNVSLGLKIKQWTGNLTIDKEADKKKLQTVDQITKNVIIVGNQLKLIICQIIKDIDALKDHLENKITTLFICYECY